MTQTYYKLAMSPEVFESAKDGITSNTIRTGVRDIACGTSNFVFAEVDAGQKETGRYLKVEIAEPSADSIKGSSAVTHLKVEDLDCFQIEDNGVPQRKEAAAHIIQDIYDHVSNTQGEDAAEETLSWAEDQLREGRTMKEVTFLLGMRQHYPDLAWDSTVTVVPFRSPVLIDKAVADEIMEANKMARGEQRQMG